MSNRAIIMLDLPEEQDVEDLLDNLGADDASVIFQRDLLDLDPRQKEAIQSLMLGVDLPVDMMQIAHNMLLASFINEDATISHMGPGNRRAMLEQARDAISKMLEEI